jgi:Pectate lyase superfamily protein
MEIHTDTLRAIYVETIVGAMTFDLSERYLVRSSGLKASATALLKRSSLEMLCANLAPLSKSILPRRLGYLWAVFAGCGLCFCGGATATPLFPADSGIINVRLMGAAGDGVTDDTSSIRRAIALLPRYDKNHPYNSRIIYFPAGTYLVSDTIYRKSSDGFFEPNLILIGESRNNTIIKLADRAPGYGNPKQQKSVIYTSSGLAFVDNPYDGGRDYPGKGEGNEAFNNTIENLTIDVGRGNPGAIGIDYLANNECAIRNVTIRAPDRASVGLSMVRKWPGPSLISNVSIENFDIGIDIAHTELSATLDRVTISGSKLYGIRNTSNIVSFSSLAIETQDGYGLANMMPEGLIAGIGGRIRGSGDGAFLNKGAVNFKDVLVDNFVVENKIPLTTRLDGVYVGQKKLSDAEWRLPVRSPPVPEYVSPAEWISVEKFGAIPDPRVDSTKAFMAAFASGARVIYIPTGQYLITRPITIADNIEQIQGMFATVRTGFYPDTKVESSIIPLFRAGETRKTPLFIRRLIVERYSNISVIISHTAPSPLVMSDIVGLRGSSLLIRSKQGGELFADNTAAGSMGVAGPAGIWFRQLNTEGPNIRINNDGAPLWILGAKSEQTNTLVKNTNAGNTEIVGGLVYRGFGTAKQMPLLVNEDGRLVASYAEEAFRPNAFYAVHLDSKIGTKHVVVRADAFPKRGNIARMVPIVSTDRLPQ